MTGLVRLSTQKVNVSSALLNENLSDHRPFTPGPSIAEMAEALTTDISFVSVCKRDLDKLSSAILRALHKGSYPHRPSPLSRTASRPGGPGGKYEDAKKLYEAMTRFVIRRGRGSRRKKGVWATIPVLYTDLYTEPASGLDVKALHGSMITRANRTLISLKLLGARPRLFGEVIQTAANTVVQLTPSPCRAYLCLALVWVVTRNEAQPRVLVSLSKSARVI
jgi:hypothetical protein